MKCQGDEPRENNSSRRELPTSPIALRIAAFMAACQAKLQQNCFTAFNILEVNWVGAPYWSRKMWPFVICILLRLLLTMLLNWPIAWNSWTAEMDCSVGNWFHYFSTAQNFYQDWRHILRRALHQILYCWKFNMTAVRLGTLPEAFTGEN